MFGKLISMAVKTVTLPIDAANAGMDILCGGDGSKKYRNDYNSPLSTIERLRDQVVGHFENKNMNKPECDFENWWERKGQFLDPDTSDVPWQDKRKALAEMAFDAAADQSGNYITDHPQFPKEALFANGRRVKIQDQNGIIILEISK